MRIDVLPWEENHLDGAAELVRDRSTALRREVPALPARYTELPILRSLLTELLRAGPGVAAIRGGRVVGFLAGWLIPSFRGKPTAFSPEWGNGAELDASRRIYEELYTHLSASWVTQGYYRHLVSMFANDGRGIDAWHWLGFGMAAADALRNLDPIPVEETGVEIRRASVDDAEQFATLERALQRYLAGAPTFLFDAFDGDHEDCGAVLRDPRRAIWMAYDGAEPTGYVGLGPASDDASTIIRDAKTASISGAFTRESSRGRGIATALVNRALAWARAEGYERCAVDFEPMNPLAARFWPQYFEPVCYTSIREVDEGSF
jgi:GNAT superfamily N-acetyltransferase